jgi:periplasmic glucans biosynthesis protein
MFCGEVLAGVLMLFDRRRFLAAFSAAMAMPAWADTAPSGLQFGPAQPFSLNGLRAMAKKRASLPYKAAIRAQVVQAIDYDAIAKIHFRPEDALWRSGPQTNPVSFFHLNRYSSEPVTVFAVNGNHARQIIYRASYFDYGNSSIDPAKLGDLGFSGFRVLDGQGGNSDWLAFQGASYFRSAGQDDQYGASARGIAVNTALATDEEFPRFSQFWLAGNGPVVTIYALLEGPSLTGIYKFDAMRTGAAMGSPVVMSAHCELFFRADISRLGVAPLTSMYWYGENQRDKAADWRPEIHDSDGLAIWNGKGERIWRPLINPPAVQTNSFVDTNPKGFGLMQRDRVFDDYQDDSVFYNKRPGIWIEPKGNWGPGAVQLVEISTNDEVHDNIVVYWRPDAPIRNGDMLAFDYQLYWQDVEPAYPKDLARVVATRIGRGGAPGQSPWPRDRRKFSIDFQGGVLSPMAARFDITPVVSLSGGRVETPYVTKVVGTDRWRAVFDITLDAKPPIDMRCFLKLGEKTLSETWIYQYFP